jgi:hypothetical protein
VLGWAGEWLSLYAADSEASFHLPIKRQKEHLIHHELLPRISPTPISTNTQSLVTGCQTPLLLLNALCTKSVFHSSWKIRIWPLHAVLTTGAQDPFPSSTNHSCLGVLVHPASVLSGWFEEIGSGKAEEEVLWAMNSEIGRLRR